jgi:hypothetical protein
LELSPQQVERIAKRAAELIEPTGGPEPYIDKRAMAAALGMSVRWVEDRLAEGLPSVLISGRRKFRRRDAERWLEASGHIDRGRYGGHVPTNRGGAACTTRPTARGENMPPTSTAHSTRGR